MLIENQFSLLLVTLRLTTIIQLIVRSSLAKDLRKIELVIRIRRSFLRLPKFPILSTVHQVTLLNTVDK